MTQAPSSDVPSDPSARPAARPGDLFVAFAKIGLTSFGGGLSGWMLREFVHQRRWLTEEEFLSGLALSQAFPGVNVANMAVWMGYKMMGSRGALASLGGLLIPTISVALIVVGLFQNLARVATVHVALGGVAAAAIGLSMQTGLRAARRAARSTPSFVIMVLTFLGIFALRLPLLWVVGAMAPVSIAIACIYQRRERAAS